MNTSEHVGSVKRIGSRSVNVEVEIDQKVRTVRLYPGKHDFKEGENVRVVRKKRSGIVAFICVYILPIILFLGAFFLIFGLVHKYLVACFLSAILLLPYYSCLLIFRENILGKFRAYKVNS